MITPTDEQVRAALEQHAVQMDGQWVFRTPVTVPWSYSEAEALKLTKVNLMLGTTPNGTITADMLLAIVTRLAELERRLPASFYQHLDLRPPPAVAEWLASLDVRERTPRDTEGDAAR